MAKATIAKTFSQFLREEDAWARRKILGEVLSFDNCVSGIPEDIDLTTKYRVVGVTIVHHCGQTIRLQHGSEFKLNRYGPDAVREWIKHQDLHLELVSPLVPVATVNNDAESHDKAADLPVEASEQSPLPDAKVVKRKPGRPPLTGPRTNPFAPRVK